MLAACSPAGVRECGLQCHAASASVQPIAGGTGVPYTPAWNASLLAAADPLRQAPIGAAANERWGFSLLRQFREGATHAEHPNDEQDQRTGANNDGEKTEHQDELAPSLGIRSINQIGRLISPNL